MSHYPEFSVDKALKEIAPQDSLLLYGSCARGDYDANSDIDLLRITTERAFIRQLDQRTTLHSYDINDLTAIARRGSLFVLHLVNEAILLKDPCGYLSIVASQFRRPSSYVLEARINLKTAASLLDVEEVLFDQAPRGFTNAALHICRTLLYAEHADQGQFSFSLRKLAEKDEAAATLFMLRHKPTSFIDFLIVRDIVRVKMSLDSQTVMASSMRELRLKSQRNALFDNLLNRIVKNGAYFESYILHSTLPKRLIN
jgi:hypothetical protein